MSVAFFDWIGVSQIVIETTMQKSFKRTTKDNFSGTFLRTKKIKVKRLNVSASIYLW